MRRLLLLALACSLCLSGCFSMLLSDHVHSLEQAAAKPENDPVGIRPVPEPRLIKAPLVCQDRDTVWRLDAENLPLYLTIAPEQARLSTQAPPCVVPDHPPESGFESDRTDWELRRMQQASRPAEPQRFLELVVTSSPLPFRPADSSGLPTLACLQLQADSTFPDDSSARMLKGSHLLAFSRHGVTSIVAVRIDARSLNDLNARRAARKGWAGLFATVPLDVVTSPIQLGVVVVGVLLAIPFGLGLLAGSMAH